MSSSTEPAIREAGPEDADRVIEMYEWLFEPPGGPPPGWDPAAARERLLEVLADPQATVFVAEGARGADDLIGLCSAAIDLLSVRYGLRCWVEDLVVDPERRSAGAGAALLAAAREWASDRGATHLELDSAVSRTDAHRFYEREGGGARGYSYSWRLDA
jgi:GNAT superfamily N-acetyltransferase